MTWLWVLVVVLVVLGSILAIAEASLTRMTRVRALALVEEKRRNAVTLESLEKMLEYDPPGAIELVAPTPLLVIGARRDSLIPVEALRAAVARAGEPKRYLELDCGHFDVYATEPFFGRAADAATDWFRTHLQPERP